MSIETFEELQTTLQDLYRLGELQQALALAEEQLPRFPEHRHLIDYWRSVLLVRMGNLEAAIEVFRRAAESGLWFGETLMRSTPAFHPLQSDPAFDEVVQRHIQMREEESELAFPLLTLRSEGRCKPGGVPCPLMIALHANAATAQASVDFWRPAAADGWLVAAPQSSQAMWRGAYIWDDRETTEQEIVRHFGSLNEQYAVDINRVVLAGHSMGGEMAVWLALRGALAVRGFIAIGPAGPFMDKPESWRQLIREYPGYGLRGYLLVGEEDTSTDPAACEFLVGLLNQAGLPCDMELVPHAGQDYAPEYEASIQRALDFVDQSPY